MFPNKPKFDPRGYLKHGNNMFMSDEEKKDIEDENNEIYWSEANV